MFKECVNMCFLFTNIHNCPHLQIIYFLKFSILVTFCDILTIILIENFFQTFFEGVIAKVASGVKESEIGYQLAFSKQELRKVIKYVYFYLNVENSYLFMPRNHSEYRI